MVSFQKTTDTEERTLGRPTASGTANAGRLSARPRAQAAADPLDRVLGYLDFRKALIQGGVTQFSCLAGTRVQEVQATHAETGEACDPSISGHTAMLEADIAEAMELYGVRAKWSAQSLTFYVQSALRGAFILARARGRPAGAAASIDHRGRYLELLFRSDTGRKRRFTGP
jgi:TetR/AcrR family transcriptional regulator, transcriptional repressor for nem operon